MKKTLLFIAIISALIFSLCACSRKNLDNMSQKVCDGYAAIKHMYHMVH